MTWKPIFDRSVLPRIHEAVDAVAEDLLEKVERLGNPSLSVGLCGPALFFSYLDRARPTSRYREASLVCLERAMDLMAGGRWPGSLFDGFCGLGWTLEHLRVADESEDSLGEIDEVLIGFLGSSDGHPPAELTRGLAGIGIYLLERLPRPIAREGLRRLLDRLEETAEHEGELRTWRTRPGEGETRGIYNLGVAHGVPGVVGFLAQLHRAGIEPERTKRLAEDAVGWLLGQQLPETENCRFPAAVGSGIDPAPARTAWCSGDLGIAAVLLLAARSFGRQDWEELALGWARLAARRPLTDVRAVDASLCHGSAGLGHLFLRLHRATNERVIGEAARFWFERVLALQRPGTGIAGFTSWSGDGHGGDLWRGEPGFQTGVAGIGLALLAASTGVEPSWDRVLAISSPSAAR